MAILNCLGQVLDLGKAPRTKETLSDFREGCRVTRHPRVFRGLTGCQRTPRDWGVTKSDQLDIIGYSDSDFARCQDSRRSTSSYIYMLVGGAISWKSAKHTLIASSTMATEFIACFEASNHGILLRNFVTGLRIVDTIERPLKIFCDNNSVVLHSNNNRSSAKSKHIDIKFLIVKERV